jgi:hypothetical protein
MSAESERGPDPRTVSVQVRDPELLSALEEAEEGASLSEVVRGALESDLIDDGSSGESDGLSHEQGRALRAMRQYVGSGNAIEVGTAESVVSNELNVPRETVRGTIFAPLREKGHISVNQRISSVYLTLGGGSE